MSIQDLTLLKEYTSEKEPFHTTTFQAKSQQPLNSSFLNTSSNQPNKKHVNGKYHRCKRRSNDTYDDGKARAMVHDVVKNHDKYEWTTVTRPKLSEEQFNKSYTLKLVHFDGIRGVFEVPKELQHVQKKLVFFLSEITDLPDLADALKRKLDLSVRIYQGLTLLRVKSIKYS